MKTFILCAIITVAAILAKVNFITAGTAAKTMNTTVINSTLIAHAMSIAIIHNIITRTADRAVIFRAAICAPAAIRAEVVLMFSAVFAVKTCSNSTVITQVTVIAQIVFANRISAIRAVIAFIAVIARLFRTVVTAVTDPAVSDMPATEFTVCLRIPRKSCGGNQAQCHHEAQKQR